MSWYLIELTDGALTPYATETESGMAYGWGEMPKRKVDLDELWEVVESLEKPWPVDKGKHDTIPREDVQLFEREMASRIRKAVGGDCECRG